MTSMIEQVARAIHRAMPERRNSPVPFTPYTMLLARAAIEAMREPTDEMLDAASPLPQHLIIERNDPEYTQAMTVATQVSQLVARQHWLDMIDEALKETP